MASVILKRKSFREVLWELFSKGGDTDTVGAIVGGLLGTYYAKNPKISVSANFDRKLVDKVVCGPSLHAIFDNFVEFSCDGSSEDLEGAGAVDLIEQEKAVTRSILQVENHRRRRCYQSPVYEASKTEWMLAAQCSFRKMLAQFGTNKRKLVQKFHTLVLAIFKEACQDSPSKIFLTTEDERRALFLDWLHQIEAFSPSSSDTSSRTVHSPS